MTLIGREALRPYNIIVAEDLNPFFPKGDYKNILQLETDIAQISESILLFSESIGSAAELGAFAMEPEIAQRLLVFIDDGNYGQNSFIRLGPIRHLEDKYGEPAVCVLYRSDLSISSIQDISGINIDRFHDRVVGPIKQRSKTAREHSTFNATRPGHIIKLIVGLIQHYGALTFNEIDICLYILNVSKDVRRSRDFLLCAEFAGWIEPHKIGTSTYYTSKDIPKWALEYRFIDPSQKVDRIRWKADILEHWQNVDPERFLAIQAALV